MFRHLVLLLIFLIAISLSYSQDHHPLPDYLSAYTSAEKFYNSDHATGKTDSIALHSYLKVISLLEKNGTNDSILFDSYLKSGILEMSAKKDEQAITLFSASIRLVQSSKSLPDSLLFKSYLFTGSSYYNINNLDSASECYKMAEALISKYPNLAESERLYNKSGALYYETGDYRKSIQYFTKALSLVENRQPGNVYFIVNYKNNIASALRKLRDYEQAMDIYKSLLPYHISKNELLHNIGVTYLNAGNYSEAIHYLKQVHYSSQLKYNDIGHAYLQLKKYDSASYFLDAAMKEYNRIGNKQKNLDYGITLKYQGDLLVETKHPTEAVTNYQRAIIQMDPDFNSEDSRKNPVSFKGLHNFFFLFDALIAKANLFGMMHTSSSDITSLQNAFSTYASAISLARQAEKNFNSDEAKLFLGNNVSAAYKEIIDLGLRLYDLTKDKTYLLKAFSYAENSKASVLQASLHELSLASIAGLPQDLIREEKNAKALIATWNIQLAGTTDSTLIPGIQKKITDLEIKLSRMQEKLDENPKYHQLKFDSRDISMDSMQQKIVKDDGAILSYYYLKNKLICFYITREEYGYIALSLQDDLQKNILLLRQMLNATEDHGNKTMRETTALIFQQLVQPVFEKIKNKKKLVIVPHNEISYIPFEILIEPNSNEYLLKKFAISYNYSVNFFIDDAQAILQTYQAFAMAPFTGSVVEQTLPALKASRAEVAMLKGKILFDKDATKQNFIQFSPEYPVIHLATHAVANDADPLRSFIEFYASQHHADTVHRLYEQEIYHLDMKSARLVILSACETGTGLLVNGEGIMSLSRAFSYAGCKTVITSLWKADDVATAFISKRLHHYLQKGFRKDESLQRAKLDYLESNDMDASHKTPAYWAHLVLIGDAQAIEKKDDFIWWVIADFILLLLVIFLVKKIRTRKTWPDRYHR